MSTVPVMRPFLGAEEAAAAAEAVLSGWVAQGPRVAAFERAFAEHVQADHGVAVSSCTAALHLALVLHGIGPGDEVVVPSLSFIATANAVRYTGATPVFGTSMSAVSADPPNPRRSSGRTMCRSTPIASATRAAWSSSIRWRWL